MPAPELRLRVYGARALLCEVDSSAAALTLAAWARAEGLAREVVPGAATVLLDGVRDPASARRRLAAYGRDPGPEPMPAPPVDDAPVELATTYDGPDLADVAARWGVSVEAAVARHSEVDYVVAFCGFAPGFGYLAGLPDELAVPRLDEPRPRVEPGSVGLAGAWCGVYPTASPGGWRLLGRTDAALWDVSREPPALLVPGAHVRFVPT